MQWTIGSKLIASFLAVMAFMAAGSSYLFHLNRKALEEAVGQGSIFLAEAAIRGIDRDIFFKIEGMQLFSENSLLRNTLSDSNSAFEKLEDREEYIGAKDAAWIGASPDALTPEMEAVINTPLSDLLRAEFLAFGERKYGVRIFGEAFVTNAYGANAAQTGRTTDYYQADEEWWVKAKGQGFSVGQVEYDASAKHWTVPLAVRVEDEKGEFLGVVKATPVISEILREAELTTKQYKSTEMRLVTEAGRLVYGKAPFEVLEPVSHRPFFQNIKGDQGFFVLKEGSEKKLFAYASSKGFRDFKGTDWKLLLSHDAREIFLPVHRLQYFLILLSGIFAVGLVFFVVLLARTISAPIRRLTQGVEYIAKGNLDVTIPYTRQDEIGRLARAFNEMAAKLRESYATFEAKVQGRTAELEERVQELDRTAKLLVRRDFEFLQTNEMLREMDEAKSRFVSIAAHQLRTPLSGVKWSMQMILSGDFGRITKGQRGTLKEALVTVDHLVKLIGDLLNVARIEAGQFKYTFAPVQAEDIASRVFSEIRAAAKNKGIKLTLSLPQKPLSRIHGDFQSLMIVLQNVAENALAYTPRGGSIDIAVAKPQKPENMIQISVKDTGMGIPADQKNLVGQKFFRADNVIRKQIPGTGLGLYIAQRILEQHSGYLEIESEEGKGTTIAFFLPLSKNTP